MQFKAIRNVIIGLKLKQHFSSVEYKTFLNHVDVRLKQSKQNKGIAVIHTTLIGGQILYANGHSKEEAKFQNYILGYCGKALEALKNPQFRRNKQFISLKKYEKFVHLAFNKVERVLYR